MAERPVYGSWDERENETHRLYQQEKKSWVITDVEIRVETTGVSEDGISTIQECFISNKIFGLHNDDSFVIINPRDMCIKQDENVTFFKDKKQMINSIKLLLFNFNQVFVPDRILPESTQIT